MTRLSRRALLPSGLALGTGALVSGVVRGCNSDDGGCQACGEAAQVSVRVRGIDGLVRWSATLDLARR